MNNKTNVVHHHSPLLASNHKVEQLSIGTTKERTIISTGPPLTDMNTVSPPETDANTQLATTQEPTEIHGTATPITEHHAMHGTPKLCTPQPHETQANTTHGLGPLAFVPQERKEIKRMSHQLAVIEAAKTSTTSNVNRAKIDRPKIPTNVDGYNSVIEACKEVNNVLFTGHCKFVTLLQGTLLALYGNYHAYKHMEYFGRTIGTELLFQLTRATEQLFGTATSEHQLLDGPLLSLDFDFLVNGICNNNLNTSQSRPALFVPTPKHTRQHTPVPRNDRIRDRGGGPQKLTNKSIVRKLPENMHKLLSEWKRKNNKSRLPSIHAIRTASNLTNDEALQLLLHLNTSTCIRYALFGNSRSSCKREHPTDITGFNATAAETILRTHIYSN
jgi:hypothetical protein